VPDCGVAIFGSATFSIGFTPPTDLYLGGLLTDLYQRPTVNLHVKEALLLTGLYQSRLLTVSETLLTNLQSPTVNLYQEPC
jgi:hypothetical protein